MVSVKKTIKVACVITAEGDISFVPNDRTSVNTAIKKWRKRAGGKKLDEHKAAGTAGGVIIITMLTRDYFTLVKELDGATMDVLRRVAERGLKAAQGQTNSEMIDLWQHMSDEISRLNQE